MTSEWIEATEKVHLMLKVQPLKKIEEAVPFFAYNERIIESG